MFGRLLATGMFCALVCSLSPQGWAQVNVLTYHNDNLRTGANLGETNLTLANLNPKNFGKLFSYGLDGDVYAQPLYVSGLNVGSNKTHNVVFVATEHNSVYALDADTNAVPSGGVLWKVNLGPSAATPNSDFGSSGSVEIVPEIGITGTPVIDLVSGTLFVVALTHETGAYFHKLHALNIITGAERSHSPVVIAGTISGNGAGSTNGVLAFDPTQHLQRCALTLANGIVYVAFASHADTDPFHGWLFGYSVANLQPQPKFVFNSTPNSTTDAFGAHAGEAGIWMGGSGPAVDAGGNLYLATGNGSFNAGTNSGTEYGCSFLKFSTFGGLLVADYFTPNDQQFLNNNDLDLGAVMLLPDQPGSVPHLLVGSGKAGAAWLLNRDRFTSDNKHYNSSGTVDLVAQRVGLGSGVMTAPAYFNGTVYLGPVKAALSAFSLSNAVLTAVPNGLTSRVFSYPGANPSVSASGNRNGIVWALAPGNSAVLTAYNATNLTVELYNSTTAGQRDQLGPSIKYAVPTIANGRVYLATHGVVSVFGLFSQSSTNSNTNSIVGNSTNTILGTYNGLFFPADGPQLFTSGSFSLTATKKGAYTGKLQLGSSRYSFRGQLSAGSASSATTALTRGLATPLTLSLQTDTDNGGHMSGIVSTRSWSAGLTADRSVFNSSTNPAPFAGRYTAIFPAPAASDSQSNAPFGNGYATIIVNRAGGVVCAASLADGTKVSQSARLAQDGHWPFYAGLPRGQGQLIGWLSLDNSIEPALFGQMSWNKGATYTSLYYSGGFDAMLYPTGSSYQPPSRGLPILAVTDAYLYFSDGSDESLTNNVIFSANSGPEDLGSNVLSFKVTPGSGLFRGTFVKPSALRPVPFSGVVLQSQNVGSGYYLFGSQSGRVDLGPRTRTNF
ncbi:MAG TPA: hypothetical protein VLT36_03880 [Candidatus Dormibacteraeota bacterium]|nr:hypothetical protein [Candidatus Dormibacteraeota bacterium]